jgi:hypothetical protein
MLHRISDSLFQFALILISIMTILFVLLSSRSTDAGPANKYFKFNILRIRPLRWLLEKRWFQFTIQFAPVILLVLIILTGLFGVQSARRNLAPVLTWTIWWALLIFDIVLLGRTWCLVCPWYAIAGWLKRWSLWKRTQEYLSLDMQWPGWLRNIYLAIILFIILTWLELGFEVTSSPLATAVLAIIMTFLVMVPSLMFEKMSFCQYGCLIGRVCGLYSMISPVEIRAESKSVCAGCKTRDCYKGNEKGYPCPTSQCLVNMDRNTYCNVCTECIKTCPNNNVSFNIRSFAADLLKPIRPRKDEAFMALVMVSLTSFHGMTMTGIWTMVINYLQSIFFGNHIIAFTAGMAGIVLIPIFVFKTFTGLIEKISAGEQETLLHPFLHYAYALIPVALFYHLSHNAAHIIAEGSAVISLVSDPFGWGWDIFGTASWPVKPLLDHKSVGWIQIILILTGHFYALRISLGISWKRHMERKSAMQSMLIISINLFLFTFFNIWLLAQPMIMRTGM